MNKVVNIPVEVCHGAMPVHYKGIALLPGVKLSLKEAGCGVPKTQLVFTKESDGQPTKVQPIAFLENVSGGNWESEFVCPGYLKIKAE